MNISQWLSHAKVKLLSSNLTLATTYDEQSAQLESELLLSHHLNQNRAFIFAYADKKLSPLQVGVLEKDLLKMSSGYPLAYILGHKSFWDMDLLIDESTLIPRSDTESLVAYLITRYPSHFEGNVLDLGTGSGAIAIALSREFNQANIFATDNSLSALNMAIRNAKQWQRASIRFFLADWFNIKDHLNSDINYFDDDFFDVIVSNPPYIDELDEHLSHLTYEPQSALIAKENGLSDLKKIIQQAKKYLKPNGLLALEHGYQQKTAVQSLLFESHYKEISTHKDLSGNNRFTIAKMT